MREQLNAVMVRRLKSELPPRWDGERRFPERKLHPLEVAYSEEEREVHRLLRAYTRSRLRPEVMRDEVERYASEFVLKLLKKRLFSSPEAFAITLKQHEESLERARKHDRAAFRPGMGILRRQVEGLDEESDDDSLLEEFTGA